MNLFEYLQILTQFFLNEPIGWKSERMEFEISDKFLLEEQLLTLPIGQAIFMRGKKDPGGISECNKKKLKISPHNSATLLLSFPRLSYINVNSEIVNGGRAEIVPSLARLGMKC